VKAEDILKAQKERSHAKASLAAYWMHLLATVSPTGYQKPVTQKEAGQLKQLSTYLGEQVRPVMAYAVEHWWKFASRAGAEAGIPFPASPHIGFLLKHHAVAVNLLTQPVQLIAPSTDEKPGYTPQSPGSQPETPHALTADELAAMIAGLKE